MKKAIFYYLWILVMLVGCGSDSAPAVTPMTPPPQLSNTAAYENYVRQHAVPISSLTDTTNFSDLASIGSAVSGKRIVQLGESTHGSKQMNQMKTRLIQYLHQQHNFSVIAFESSMFACNQQLERQTSLSIQLMRDCIFGVWRTQEVSELFKYIISTQATDRPLRLAGFDVQPSSQYDTVQNLLIYLEAHLGQLQLPELKSAVQRMFNLRADLRSCMNNTQVACSNILTEYQNLTPVFKQVADVLLGGNREMQLASLISRAMIYEIEYYQQMARGYRGSAGFRDQYMAENLTNLIKVYYPNEKVMVWAHNSHITTDYITETYRAQQDKSMGMHLDHEWRNQLYTIGFYMLSGQSADNQGEPIQVTPHNRDSLESIVSSANRPQIFLPLTPQNQPGPEDDWLHQLTETKYWGAWIYRIYPAQSYDGIIVIGQSSLPSYQQ